MLVVSGALNAFHEFGMHMYLIQQHVEKGFNFAAALTTDEIAIRFEVSVNGGAVVYTRAIFICKEWTTVICCATSAESSSSVKTRPICMHAHRGNGCQDHSWLHWPFVHIENTDIECLWKTALLEGLLNS